MTEEQAKSQFGESNIKIYNSTFVNLFYAPYQVLVF